ncbi:hypothetical protein MLD38_017724 [Melastoma candidum]|uniref:Uncharacterized protein n=1 Tax=Melastoma candidum TaxID=119954 RepID=A0ACB9QRL2_9MYRT|nr:hypothetical protein MLD38_017724 [Melastoma candidum]
MPPSSAAGNLLLLLVVVVIVAVIASLADAANDDSAIMGKLLSSLSPPGWSSSTPYCTWKGVTCESSQRVTSLSLSSQSISGTLPSDLTSLTSLRTLFLQKNSLSGPLPNLSALSSLQEVFLDNNNFTSVPDSIFKGLSSLKTLSLSNNPDLLPWLIPSDLAESTSLVTLYAGGANVMGTLPDFLGSLPSLQNLRLSYNNITGPLPASFKGSGIQNLWLNNQDLGMEGRIDVLAGMSQLQQVWLHKNKFSGPIPDLSGCGSLFDLQLRDNNLAGVVPSNLMSLPSILNVSLDNNKLQGPMPDNPKNIKLTLGDTNSFCNTMPGPCDAQVTTLLKVAAALGYPPILAESWTGNDACAGWSFITCQGKNITSVTFSRQGFTGTISPAFAELPSLKSLLLNDNHLTGSIPSSLTKLPQLQTLDVSNNNLSGLVPTFPSTVKFISSGNPLLGKVLKGTDGGSTSGSTSDSSGSSGSASAGLIAGLVVAVLVFLGVVLFVAYRFYYSKRRNGKPGRSRVRGQGKQVPMNQAADPNGMDPHDGIHDEMLGDDSNILGFEGGNVSISIDVLRGVTDDFSDVNEAGRGGFGVVYRGVLHDGTMIAVKRMECSAVGSKGMSEFQAEINVLTKVRHRHLVALLGYCVNGNERLLVYEYMPQGSLTQRLFEWERMGYQPLSWKQRITIALDVARGVEYLHSLAQQSFIHRDLKPSNILLGDDLRAKVADFGLVKPAPEGKYSLETRLAGTFGYLAPEYAATGRVTTKVDVYAFGVVLMEMLTGRKALDNSLPDEMSHLVPWFRRVMVNKENIPKALDPTLYLDDDTMESIHKVAELAGHCTAREPYQRPDMSHAVNILAPLVEQWKPAYHHDEDSFGINLDMSLPQALQRWQAEEGTSRMFDSTSYSQTESSIQRRPSGIPYEFESKGGR